MQRFQSLILRLLFLGLCLLGCGATSLRLEPLIAQRAASANAWQSFLAMSSAARTELWQEQQELAAGLGAWHWTWRIAWLRSCAEDPALYCHGLLVSGLDDAAMVVRAEAATALGNRFAGSEDSVTLRLLTAAYANPRNRRGGKALMVQYRILFALKQLGGDEALAAARALANLDAGAQYYWQRLAKIATIH